MKECQFDKVMYIAQPQKSVPDARAISEKAQREMISTDDRISTREGGEGRIGHENLTGGRLR
jgi:hypothetical protein